MKIAFLSLSLPPGVVVVVLSQWLGTTPPNLHPLEEDLKTAMALTEETGTLFKGYPFF